MRVLFLGCLYSDSQKDLFFKTSKRGYQFAAQNLQESIIDGFLANSINTTVVTIPSLSTFPLGSRLPIVKDTQFIYLGNDIGKSFGFINIPLFRNKQSKRCLDYITSWCNQDNKEQSFIVVYGLHVDLMEIAIKIKKENPKTVICSIIPDLPEFMGANKYLKMLGWQKRNIKQVHDLVPNFDCYVPLAAPMMENLDIQNKPFTVMEGIFSDVKDPLKEIEKAPGKVILYTGNLNKRYGIIDLLDAFQIIKDENYSLWIRGNGDAKEEVILRSQEDSRIRYFEQMSKHDLLKLQKKATLLVNTVTPSMNFSRFFFPSKTMDYLASGTPTIMFRLECLPQEYHDHLFFFESEDIKSMSAVLRRTCELDKTILFNKGKRASDFIYSEKNSKKQVKKIIDLLDSIKS